jgi:hypothetical protein
MSPFWTIEYRVEPCMEHMHVEGFALRIEGSASPGQSASVWVAFGGWMEQPETLELRKLQRSEIPWEQAEELIEELRSMKVQAAPLGVMGLHGTTHKLVVECGFNSLAYKWWHELPSEWGGIAATTRKLKKVAHEARTHSAA